MNCIFEGCADTSEGGTLTMVMTADYAGASPGAFPAEVTIEGRVCGWHLAMLRRRAAELYGRATVIEDGWRVYRDGAWLIRVGESTVQMEHEGAPA